MPDIPLDSALAVLVVLQQLIIGLALGFAVRIVFANGRAAEIAAMDVCTSGTLTISPTELIASQ